MPRIIHGTCNSGCTSRRARSAARARCRSRDNRAVNDVTPETAAVGWVGTGVMGSSMCGHLIDAGCRTTVNSRTRTRAEPLLARGAAWADSPAEVAAAADVVFTMVGFPADVREVILGSDGVLAGARSGGVLVDMATSEPAPAEALAAASR